MIGIAIVNNAGGIERTWALKASDKDVLRRLFFLRHGIADVMDTIAKEYAGHDIQVVIEDGIYHAVPSVIAILGEVRGMIYAEAWRVGLDVRVMSPMTWKTRLTKEERRMVKNGAYVRYWNDRLGTDLKTPDEVDAVQIGLRCVLGKTA
jgi:Holliday junction resolvasome RuvABC endonuclease subunit